MYPATFIAEIFTTSALHMVAACRPFDPKVAMRTLFKFASNDVIHKFNIVFVFFLLTLILFTSFICVVFDPTVQTVLNCTNGALELI